MDFLKNIRRLLPAFLLSLVLSPAASADHRLVVVANTGGKTMTLSREQVRNLFMGASLGYDFNPVSLPPHHHLRLMFNTQVIGLSESRIQSYWSQMKFTGRLRPPKELSSQTDILQFISESRGNVGYLPDTAEIPATLTVVYATDF
ncbi:MAG: hypothetical protein CMI13_04675 [Oleibacter sp.]|nr:hypothetical protein [Thalassolituus sp.]